MHGIRGLMLLGVPLGGGGGEIELRDGERLMLEDLESYLLLENGDLLEGES